MSNSPSVASDLKITQLSKSFGPRMLWSELSFTLQVGAMVAVTGPSGCGKTTLLNCIGLLERFDNGSIEFGDWRFSAHFKPGHNSMTGVKARQFFRDVLGFLFQNYGLVESWNVRQNLLVPLRNQPGIKAADRSRLMERALSRVGLDGALNEKVFTLSGGEQQRVALARLILKRPSINLADEPTSALDHTNRDLVMEILAEQAGQGALVIISTHSDHITGLCSHNIALGGAAGDNAGHALGLKTHTTPQVA